MKKALIENTMIRQIVEDGEEFEVHDGLIWVDVPNTTATDDTYVDNAVVKYSPPLKTLDGVKSDIDKAMHSRLKQGILWAFNQGETPYQISLHSGMRETLTTFERLISKGHLNPHRGYLQSNGTKIKKPDDSDLSDGAVDEIAVFAGQWSLAIADIAITEKENVSAMTDEDRQSYDATEIDWSVVWSGHADWSDDLVLYNP